MDACIRVSSPEAAAPCVQPRPTHCPPRVLRSSPNSDILSMTPQPRLQQPTKRPLAAAAARNARAAAAASVAPPTDALPPPGPRIAAPCNSSSSRSGSTEPGGGVGVGAVAGATRGATARQRAERVAQRRRNERTHEAAVRALLTKQRQPQARLLTGLALAPTAALAAFVARAAGASVQHRACHDLNQLRQLEETLAARGCARAACVGGAATAFGAAIARRQRQLRGRWVCAQPRQQSGVAARQHSCAHLLRCGRRGHRGHRSASGTRGAVAATCRSCGGLCGLPLGLRTRPVRQLRLKLRVAFPAVAAGGPQRSSSSRRRIVDNAHPPQLLRERLCGPLSLAACRLGLAQRGAQERRKRSQQLPLDKHCTRLAASVDRAVLACLHWGGAGGGGALRAAPGLPGSKCGQKGLGVALNEKAREARGSKGIGRVVACELDVPQVPAPEEDAREHWRRKKEGRRRVDSAAHRQPSPKAAQPKGSPAQRCQCGHAAMHAQAAKGSVG
eukprot:364896-Chlamydomonas_euryale.AAC.14